MPAENYEVISGPRSHFASLFPKQIRTSPKCCKLSFTHFETTCLLASAGPTDCSKAYSTTTNLEAWATTAPTLSPVVVQPGKTGQVRQFWGDVAALLPAAISAGVKPKVAHDDTKPVELPDTAHMAEIATLGKTKLTGS